MRNIQENERKQDRTGEATAQSEPRGKPGSEVPYAWGRQRWWGSYELPGQSPLPHNRRPCASHLPTGAETEGSGTRGSQLPGWLRCPGVRSPAPRLAPLSRPCQRRVALVHHGQLRVRQRHQVTEENYQRRKTSHPEETHIIQGHSVEYSTQETFKKEMSKKISQIWETRASPKQSDLSNDWVIGPFSG